MARPLSTTEPSRGGANGNYPVRYHLEDANDSELEQMRSENAQLRALCADLEQALQESTQQGGDVTAFEERLREYEMILEEKTETIRSLHQQLEETQASLVEASNQPVPRSGPLPREDELLSLSEELERERRQLQEDEQALMEQMRQMEMSMARERAEMARQRNDLQRLYGEIRHELERLERNGALQNKMDELKSKLQDVSTRRGAAPGSSVARPPSSSALPQVNPNGQGSQAAPPQQSRGGLMGRIFGGGGSSK